MTTATKDMYATVAYVTPKTPLYDVEFSKTPLMTDNEVARWVTEVSANARTHNVRLLAFEVYKGTKLLWTGLL